MNKEVHTIRSLLLLIALFLLVACGPSAQPAAESSAPADAQEATSAGTIKTGGTLTWIFPRDIATLDPHVTSSRYDDQLLYQIYGALMERDDDLNLVPGLATEWTVSDDGLLYTLKLREGVKFHDGTPFNAEAVVKNLERIVDPETKSERAKFFLGPYESSRAVDDLTVEIKMSERYGPLLNVLADIIRIVSPAAIEQYGQDIYNHPVGAGPFIFKEWVLKDHITLVRNPDYNWAPSTYENQGPAYLDEIVVRFILEPSTRLASLEAGEGDVVMELPPDDLERIQQDPQYDVKTILVAGTTVHYLFNTQKEPTNDLKFRQALTSALNRDEINEIVTYGLRQVAKGPLSPNALMYDPEAGNVEYNSYDPERANRLLDELGWTMNSSTGIREKDGQPLKLTFLVLSETPEAAGAEIVQSQLKAVGVDVEILVESNPAQQADAQKGIHHMGGMSWSGSDPNILTNLFHSENIGVGWNFTHYSNPDLDALLDEQARETDPEKRAQLISQIQHTVMENAVIYPPFPITHFWGAHTYVKNMNIHPVSGIFRPYEVWLDK
jgi:peptide/nickel transport system substrate-binding protein